VDLARSECRSTSPAPGIGQRPGAEDGPIVIAKIAFQGGASSASTSSGATVGLRVVSARVGHAKGRQVVLRWAVEDGRVERYTSEPETKYVTGFCTAAACGFTVSSMGTPHPARGVSSLTTLKKLAGPLEQMGGWMCGSIGRRMQHRQWGRQCHLNT